MAITFDDGFASVLELAFPILSSLEMVATVFVVTDLVDAGKPLDWPGIEQGGGPDRDVRGLSWAQLEQLADAGWEVGSHTRTHPRLTQLDDETLADELRGSRAACERALGRPCRSLAYPFGDVDTRVVEAAREAGYEAAASLPTGVVGESALEWPRIGVYRKDSLRRFRLKVSPTVLRVREALAPVERRRAGMTAVRVLVVTNMYPTEARPAGGTFVADQVRSLRADGGGGGRAVRRPGHRGSAGVPRSRRTRARGRGEVHPDLVHVMYGGVMADVVTRAVEDRPVLVTFHGDDLQGNAGNGLLDALSGWYSTVASARAARRAAGVVVVSPHLRDAIAKSVNGSRVWVVPNGVDLGRFRPRERAECQRAPRLGHGARTRALPGAGRRGARSGSTSPPPPSRCSRRVGSRSTSTCWTAFRTRRFRPG